MGSRILEMGGDKRYPYRIKSHVQGAEMTHNPPL